MIVIPQKLFRDPQVKVILRDGNVCILRKILTEPILEREGYISNHVVSILLSGEQQIRTFDDEVIRIKAGELLFVPRGMYYVSDLLPGEGPFESLLFYFDDRLIQEFLSVSRIDDFNRDAGPDFLKFSTPPAIKLFAQSLLHIYDKHEIRQKKILDLKILELLHLFNSQVSEGQFADFLFRLTLPKKRNLKSFMQQNFDKPLKIEDYAYLTGRSPSSFRRDFKHFFETTPQKWIKYQRLEKAHQMLSQDLISITDLAFAVGYENVSYFIKEFKAVYGVSPKQMTLLNRRKN